MISARRISDVPADRCGVAGALRFFAAIRADADLHAQVAALEPEGGLRALAALAALAGFGVGPEDLRVAHAHDWGLRQAHYACVGSPSVSAASTVAVVNSPSSST